MQLAKRQKNTGVSAKMMRHYESIGLIPAADRRDSNYRDYRHDDLHRLGLIRRASDLGFPVDEIRELLRLRGDRRLSNSEVGSLTLEHIAQFDRKIGLLNEMRTTLAALLAACDGDHRRPARSLRLWRM